MDNLKNWQEEFKQAVHNLDPVAEKLWKDFQIHCINPRLRSQLGSMLSMVAGSNNPHMFGVMLQSNVWESQESLIVHAFSTLVSRSDDTSMFFSFIPHLKSPKMRSTVLQSAVKNKNEGWVKELLQTLVDITPAYISAIRFLDCEHMLPLFEQALGQPHITVDADSCIKFSLRALSNLLAQPNEVSQHHVQNRIRLITHTTPYLTNLNVWSGSLLYYAGEVGQAAVLSSLTSSQWDSALEQDPYLAQTPQYANHLASVLHEEINKNFTGAPVEPQPRKVKIM